MKYNNSRVRGETLHFAMHALNLSNAGIESQIDHIGRGKRGWGVTRNPKLTTDVETVLCQISSIVKSDCHIDINCHLTYSDRNVERLRQVHEAANQFGDVDCSIRYHNISGTPYLHIPAVVGRLFVDLGMSTGDKAIHNEALPRFVMESKPEAKRAYLKELGSDDASFDIEKEYDRGSFQWCRSVVLHAGDKSEMYSHRPLVSPQHVDFIREKGTLENATYGQDGEEHPTRVLRIGELKRIAEEGSKEEQKTARSLVRVIQSNPSRLLESEKQLCADLGIRTRRYPIAVRFFEDSGRVSVVWQGHSATREDTMKWVRFALPSHPDKRERIKAWLQLMETEYVKE